MPRTRGLQCTALLAGCIGFVELAALVCGLQQNLKRRKGLPGLHRGHPRGATAAGHVSDHANMF